MEIVESVYPLYVYYVLKTIRFKYKRMHTHNPHLFTRVTIFVQQCWNSLEISIGLEWNSDIIFIILYALNLNINPCTLDKTSRRNFTMQIEQDFSSREHRSFSFIHYYSVPKIRFDGNDILIIVRTFMNYVALDHV